jgi:branched-chain amino acid transport system permease protein
MKYWLVRAGSIALAVIFAFAVHNYVKGMSGDLPTRLVVLSGLYVTLAVSLNLINGITGQFSIGHAAFYMVGAYTAGALSNGWMTQFGWPAEIKMFVLMLIAAASAAVAGLIVGLPSLRLRGSHPRLRRDPPDHRAKHAGHRRRLWDGCEGEVQARLDGRPPRHPLHRCLPQPS